MNSEALHCGLLGRTLGHSYSPAIHTQLAAYSYRLYEKEPEELEDFLHSGEFDGLNVTIPYKKAVIPYCAELSDTARAKGARLRQRRCVGDGAVCPAADGRAGGRCDLPAWGT